MALSRFLAADGASLCASSALAALLKAQGRRLCLSNETRGLHPLVIPLAERPSGSKAPTLGLLQYPLRDGRFQLVEAWRQGLDASDLFDYNLVPLGTPAQFAQRSAVEADAVGDRALLAASQSAAAECGAGKYEPGTFKASGRTLDQFLLLKVGPFVDVWESMARMRMRNGEHVPALVAAERAAALNPFWGCCSFLQSELMYELGRDEERRDLALAALEQPFWTLGATLDKVQAAASLSHVDDVRQMMRELEQRAQKTQGAEPLPQRDIAEQEAMDALDKVVRTRGGWDDVRSLVSDAFARAELDFAARVSAA